MTKDLEPGGTSCWHVSLLRGAIAAVSCAAAFVSCSSDSGPLTHLDRGKAAVHLDRGQGLVSLDLAHYPTIQVTLYSPAYLATNVAADATIGMLATVFEPLTDEVVQTIVDACRIESYPSLTPVGGGWTRDPYSSYLTFTPAVPLAPGEYVVRFPNANPDFVVRPRPYNVFHVGPTPLRLSEIEVLRAKPGPADLVRITLRYSDVPPTAATVQAKVEQFLDGTWTSMPVTVVSVSELRTSTPLDPNARTRITVEASFLDGGWTGVAGSSPAVVDFYPIEYQIEPGQIDYPVPANLSIDLPSGNKKN